MAYIALYRAYRPQSFKDVVGQQHIVKTIQNALKNDKIAHAYLFSGPRGTGKTTLAKLIAKALNCPNLDENCEPCNECDICKGITKGMITDVVEIDAASNNGADDIRELRDGVKFSPSVGKYKVYIIDEVHMLSNAAFNALLKTLEEPPKNVVFILATTEPYKLPNTILSRCQRFDFQAISVDDIIFRLNVIIKDENIRITPEAIRLIAEYSEGGMRDAISMLDQTLAYSASGNVTVEEVLAVSGATSQDNLLKIISACHDHKDALAIQELNELLNEGKEIPRIINDLLMFLRDMLMYQNRIVISNKAIYDTQEYQSLAKVLNNGLIYSWLDLLNAAQNNMRFSNQKKAYLELALLKMSDVKINDPITVLDKVDQLEREIQYLKNKLGDLSNNNSKNVSYTIPGVKPTIEEKIPEPVFEPEPTNVGLEPKPIGEANNQFVTTDDVLEVLNNPNKQKKALLLQILPKLENRYTNLFIVQILIKGEIVAASDNKFIVVLMDEGFCNRLMKYESFVKIMEILNQNEHLFDDYICLPKVIWESIKKEYLGQFKNGVTKPILSDIVIPVRKKIIPSNPESDPFLDTINDLFDKDVIKMED